MIDKEIISKNEAENDGQTIHLYYDEIAGMYMAFGLSAYYTTMVTDPYMSFPRHCKSQSPCYVASMYSICVRA